MGIQGLLPVLKSTITPVHVREYAGKTVAVDTYSWLHKGAFTCSKELCQGLPTTKYIDYCMHRINLLRQHGVKPLLVFDGGRLPMKEEQEIKRARVRKDNLERALEHELSGNHAAAYDCYQKAVDITPQVAFQLIKILRQEKVDYVVAPYEADSQMAFLSMNGHVDVVITEDSDLIPFGCPKVMFKMDKFGQGVEFQYDDLAKNRDLNFASFTKHMLLEMCILSGCDYLPSLQGMGVKRAHGLIRRFRNYQKVVKHLRYSGVCVPSHYEEMFMKALLTFRHQRVYDPVLQDIVHLTQVPSDLTLDLEFLGPAISQKLGQGIARGEIDPITRETFELVIVQDRHIPKLAPSKTGNTNGARKRPLDLPVQKNLLTNYFLSASEEAKRQFKAPRNTIMSDNVLDRFSLDVEDDGFQIFKVLEPLGGSEDLTAGTNFTQHCRSPDFLPSILQENQSNSSLNFEMEDSDFMCQRKKQFEGCKFNSKGPFSASSEHAMGTLALKTSNPFVSSGHAWTTSSVPRKSSNERAGQENFVVRSAYFSSSRSKQTSLTSSDKEPSMSNDDTVDCDSDRDFPRVQQDNSETKSLTDSLLDDFEGTSEHQPQLIITKAITDGSCLESRIKHGGKSVDLIAAGKRKHVPSFSSNLLGVGVQRVSFASNTSHIERYTSIAQKSMERFVSSIAPFRCTATGARASGLRPPVKSCINVKVGRDSAIKNKSAEDLNKFAFAPSNCKPSSMCQGKSASLATDAARWNDSCAAEWN